MEGRPGGQSICGQTVVCVWWGQISLENSDLSCHHSGAQSIPYLSHEAWTDDCIALPVQTFWSNGADSLCGL